jgi:PIN domain nuclease of toxin-antitoxin system
VIVLDTHVLVWLALDDSKLGRRTAALIDRALHEDAVGVCSFSFWEVGMLVAKRRLRVAPNTLRSRALSSGMIELALDGVVAIESTRLRGFHGDPADRIIVATALANQAALATADERILRWRSGGLTTHDARV